MKTSPPPIALTIAGSDSGGGAGIQADLKTFHTFGVFGTSAVTAITAQNTRGVTAVHAVPVEMVRGQIDAVATDLRPAALKSGMLATAALVEAVAEAIRANELIDYVMDPVMVASSGDRLLDPDAEGALLEHLFPLARLVTPNLPEAEILVGREVRDVAAMRAAARALVDLGAGAALVKGGHLEGNETTDLFWDGTEERRWRRPRVNTRSTHGTGCTLSAAVAAALALGLPLDRAVEVALDFVARAIETAPGLGGGHGPINHFAPVVLDSYDVCGGPPGED
jgi:hydroxymethylpyrimidine/phosphomethylpyrimidine kinase